MKVREEIEQRALAVINPDVALGEPLISGWTFYSDDWPQATQVAVKTVMGPVNALLDMAIRLAEEIDELRDASEV